MSQEYRSTGRRKNAVARVILVPGTGNIEVNGRPYDDYFPNISMQNQLLEPLQVVGVAKKFDVKARASGGGSTGQLGAIRLGISRALVEHDAEMRGDLKAGGMLRRDPRMKERKKPGQPGARKRFQFSKR